MPLKPLSEEQIAGTQSDLRKQFFKEGGSPVLNEEHALALGQTTRFEMPQGSGKFYDVPAVSYKDGLELQRCFGEIRKSQEHGAELLLSHYEFMLRRVLDIAWRLSVPVSRVERLRKATKFIRNPFLRCSEGDIAALMSFFLVRRMMQNVKFHYPASLAETRSLSTPSTS